MADKPYEPDDPMARHAVSVPAGPEATVDMVYAVAEEFARLGFDEGRVLRLFRSPFYAVPHAAYRALGEPAVRAIVAECVHAWRPAAGRLAAPTPEGA